MHPLKKTTKMLVTKLQTHIPLQYTFNVKNTTHLIADIKGIQVDPDLKFSSYDITDMYSKVPIHTLTSSIEQLCNDHHIDLELKSEIITLSRLITTQNYFQFQGKTYIQKEGLAMGAPTFSLFS
jgi:Tfp pilus assembly protein PilO